MRDSLSNLSERPLLKSNQRLIPPTPLTTPPKTTIQKQGLIPYQLGYCKEILLYAIVRKLT